MTQPSHPLQSPRITRSSAKKKPSPPSSEPAPTHPATESAASSSPLSEPPDSDIIINNALISDDIAAAIAPSSAILCSEPGVPGSTEVQRGSSIAHLPPETEGIDATFSSDAIWSNRTSYGTSSGELSGRIIPESDQPAEILESRQPSAENSEKALSGAHTDSVVWTDKSWPRNGSDPPLGGRERTADEERETEWNRSDSPSPSRLRLEESSNSRAAAAGVVEQGGGVEQFPSSGRVKLPEGVVYEASSGRLPVENALDRRDTFSVARSAGTSEILPPRLASSGTRTRVVRERNNPFWPSSDTTTPSSRPHTTRKPDIQPNRNLAKTSALARSSPVLAGVGSATLVDVTEGAVHTSSPLAEVSLNRRRKPLVRKLSQAVEEEENQDEQSSPTKRRKVWKIRKDGTFVEVDQSQGIHARTGQEGRREDTILSLPKYFEYPSARMNIESLGTAQDRNHFSGMLRTLVPHAIVTSTLLSTARTTALGADFTYEAFIKELSQMPETTLPGSSSRPEKKLEIEYRPGDLFDDVPDGTLIVHSCNAKGVWGAGIAKEFRKRYDVAYLNYRYLCNCSDPNELLDRAMLILPATTDVGASGSAAPLNHYIGCLFVREGYGAVGREVVVEYIDNVVKSTGIAMKFLLDGIRQSIEYGELAPDAIKEIRMPKINAGFFQVPWNRTEEVLLEVEVKEEWPALCRVVVYTG